MKCSKCNGEEFDVEVEVITEYHDAAKVIKGKVRGNRFEVDKVIDNSSWYVEEIKAKCSKCGNVMSEIDDDGINEQIWNEV